MKAAVNAAMAARAISCFTSLPLLIRKTMDSLSAARVFCALSKIKSARCSGPFVAHLHQRSAGRRRTAGEKQCV